MHLHGNLAQALLPGTDSIFQFPGTKDATEDLPDTLDSLLEKLQYQDDPSREAVKKVGEKWGRLELVDASYKGMF